MKTRRLLLGVAGFALVLIAWLGGDFTGLLPIEQAVALAGNDFVFVTVLAAVGVAVALVAVASGRDSAMDETEFRDPEYPLDLPLAGESFDDAVGPRSAALPVVGTVDRGMVRDRLQRTTVDTLVRKTEAGRETAERLVRAGEWTEDVHAAAFLAPDARPPVTCLLRAWITGRPWFQVGATRTAREIVAVSDVDGGQR